VEPSKDLKKLFRVTLFAAIVIAGLCGLLMFKEFVKSEKFDNTIVTAGTVILIIGAVWAYFRGEL
jgi:glucose uptake protein GlcU